MPAAEEDEAKAKAAAKNRPANSILEKKPAHADAKFEEKERKITKTTQ